ncbi:hypothetical protein ILYODFUR_028709 [Ilyodon furcidens]|uniref:Uncharacterized protein n=1 Tax=Ilyodon furcidens TaxID=33524 RepID=A0ABV0SQ12_9TELE
MMFWELLHISSAAAGMCETAAVIHPTFMEICSRTLDGKPSLGLVPKLQWCKLTAVCSDQQVALQALSTWQNRDYLFIRVFPDFHQAAAHFIQLQLDFHLFSVVDLEKINHSVPLLEAKGHRIVTHLQVKTKADE